MKILFQGDSITDAGRDRSDIHNLGNGYPKFAAENIKEAINKLYEAYKGKQTLYIQTIYSETITDSQRR